MPQWQGKNAARGGCDQRRSASARRSAKNLFDRAVEALGHEGITDVITLMGFYTSVSMTLAFYDARAKGVAR